MVNAAKFNMYESSNLNGRLHRLASFVSFNIGCLPFWYLGVPIFKGKLRDRHLQPINDKIKSKLAFWKVSLFSFAGRTQLVKSMIQSILTHLISLYG